MDVVHATALITRKGFEYLRDHWGPEQFYYASRQERLVKLVGDGGTLWVFTYTEPGEDQHYQLAYKLGKCRRVDPPENFKAFGPFGVHGETALVFLDNDATDVLLNLSFEPAKPIKDRTRIGQSLQTIRQLSRRDIEVLEEFQRSLINWFPGGFEVSASVYRVINDVRPTTPVTSWEIVRELIGYHGEHHPEYADGRAATLVAEDTPSFSRTKLFDYWLRGVTERLNPETVKTLHGRLLILGLARVDPELDKFLREKGFLQKIEEEMKEPVEECFLKPAPEELKKETPGDGRPPPPPQLSPDAGPLHMDSPETVDRLGRQSFAKSLARRLGRIWRDCSERSEKSFVIHLHGRWGAGKTTLLRFICNELEPVEMKTKGGWTKTVDWVVVNFNAWQHQHVEPPWWSLLDKVYRESAGSLKRSRGFWRSLRFRAGEQWRRFFAGRSSQVLAVVFFISLTFPCYMLMKGIAEASGSDKGWPAAFTDAGNLVLVGVSVIVVIVSAAKAVSRSLVLGSSHSAQTFVRHKSAPTDLVRCHFGRLVRAINGPILVVVDDLDRCRREYVVNLLEGIQTLFSNPRVMYILAADRSWIQACFEKTYEDFTGSVQEPGRRLGSLFLEKAVQLSVPVPRLTSETQTAYWNFLLNPVESTRKAADEMLEEERKKFRDANTQEKVFSLIREQEPDVGRRLAKQQAAVEQLGTAEVEKSTEHFLSDFASLQDPNPRAMKRLINAYATQRDLAVLAGLDDLDIGQWKQLVLWTIVSLRWPLLEEYLVALASDPETEPSPEVQALLDSASVTRVLEGAGVDCQLEIEWIRKFAVLRGSEDFAGTAQ